MVIPAVGSAVIQQRSNRALIVYIYRAVAGAAFGVVVVVSGVVAAKVAPVSHTDRAVVVGRVKTAVVTPV